MLLFHIPDPRSMSETECKKKSVEKHALAEGLKTIKILDYLKK